MGKKKAFTKGSKEANVPKNVFNVNKVSHKKKAKAVKTNVKKLKANVKAQQERADDRLKNLHESMVTKTSKNQKKINLKKSASRAPAPSASAVQNNLEKMNL